MLGDPLNTQATRLEEIHVSQTTFMFLQFLWDVYVHYTERTVQTVNLLL